MTDSNVLTVSFDAVGDSFSKVFRLSSSRPRATKRAFGFDPLSVCFTKQTNELKYIFDFDFPLFRKHCYLSSFQVLLTLHLQNISGCLYKSPQFHFFVFVNDLV